MTTGDPHGPAPVGVSALLAGVVGTVCFGALGILGLGMLSFFADIAIISVEGLTLWPGIVGMAVAIGAFALMIAPLLRRRRPSFGAVVLIAVGTALAHLAAVWLSALVGGSGIAHAAAAASQIVVRGSSVVVVVAALIAGWIAVGLRHARSGTPRWPWERDDSE
ncbi:hypothetical protein FVO59_02400 [Microbacterium esteraromaticum]|uniref:Uncharacterized protein n=1 Tax=Microbacterium esteraromaticum TaxID=57043 RepID=A0A7D8A6T4_9MICO|nr:hypothetical protein [Microbacterium esteraromaticum]QMU96180.1 hypothetical protein FVO59_02400 [Microbacterium esteraromaticum]